MTSCHDDHEDNLHNQVDLNEQGQKEEAHDAADVDVVGVTAGQVFVAVHEAQHLQEL